MFGHNERHKHVGVGVQMFHAAALHFESGDVISDVASRFFRTADRRVRDDIGWKDAAQHLLRRHTG